MKIIKNQGFTLLEVAIVVLIAGILLATLSAALLNFTRNVQTETTRDRLEAISGAMQLFLSLNGRYPCVADPHAQADSATFGFELGSPDSDCTADPSVGGIQQVTAPAPRNPRRVRIGAVPVRTLNLPDEYIADAWGRRFTYAVTEALATSGTYNRNEGAVSVVDSNNNSLFADPGVGHYAVVSHGESGAGSYGLTGGNNRFPCTAGTMDQENCDDDTVFRSTLLAGTANNNSFFDDLLIFKSTSPFDSNEIPENAVMAFDRNTCPDGWDPYPEAIGRSVIGAGTYGPVNHTVDGLTWNDPQETLDVGEDGGYASRKIKLGYLGWGDTTAPMVVTAGTTIYAASTGTGEIAYENRSPYLALLYCIKTTP